MKPATKPPDLLLRDVAAQLVRQPSTVRAYVRQGFFPGARLIRGRWAFTQKDVADFLATNTRKLGAKP